MTVSDCALKIFELRIEAHDRGRVELIIDAIPDVIKDKEVAVDRARARRRR